MTSTDTAPAPAPERDDAAEHRRFGIDANNSVRDILDRPQPWSLDDVDDVLERAYAAAYHWRRAEGSGPANRSRAAWLISRVHAYAATQQRGHADLAYHHASQCMRIVTAVDLHDFDRAYAHEAVARAAAACGNLPLAADHRARALAVPVADAEDARLVREDVEGGPWFGLAPAEDAAQG